MRHISLMRALFGVFLAVTCASAYADLLVGNYRGSGAGVNNPVLRFTPTANGNVAPFAAFHTNLGGGAEVMASPTYLTYEPVENVIYVSDFTGQAIRVYAAEANGNVAALRVLNPPLLGQPRRVALDTLDNELFTTASGCCIAVYARTASGSGAIALRTIQWGGLSGSVTRLNYPQGVAWRASSDEIIVVDSSHNPDNSYSGVVLFFARTASGNAAPTRVIEGSQTQLGSAAYALAYDAAHDEIIVVAADASNNVRIDTFAGTATANAAPLRSIAGNLTLLDGVAALAYDAATGTIYVSEGGYNAIPARVLAFPRSADGNVAPARVIAGTTTTLMQPVGLEVAPSGIVFSNGFE